MFYRMFPKRYFPLAVMAWLALLLFTRATNALTITVNTTNDSGAGSLRQAILDANANAGLDTIDITATGTINLLTALPPIDEDAELLGPGADNLTVRRSDGAPEFRIFDIAFGQLVFINDLTIANGIANGPDFVGGGIRAAGQLRLSRCVVRDNFAFSGGGIGTTTDVPVLLRIRDCTIINNIATVAGGGIQFSGGQFTSLVNSTVSGNTSGLGAGVDVLGINGLNAQFFICDSTIANNNGVGILCENFSGTASADLQNTIVANNTVDLDTVGGATIVSGGHNLIGSNEEVAAIFPAGLPNANDDYVGTPVSPLDPKLMPLGDNGGPTPTLALDCDSPAIDVGGTFGGGLGLDQRGQSRFNDGSGDGNAQEDIGAFELQRYPVTTLADSGAGSLRQAITDNNAAGGGLIEIEPSGTITLLNALPFLNRDVSIRGPGANCSDIHRDGGAFEFGILTVNPGAHARISGVTLSNGLAFGSGGGIFNNGSLTVDSCILRDNVAPDLGGAIAATGSGSFLVQNSSFLNNRSLTNHGGALLYGHGGVGQVINSTFHGNESGTSQGGLGGGVAVFGVNSVLDLIHCTVTGNHGAGAGGIVIFFSSNTVNLINTVVAGNTAASDPFEMEAIDGGSITSFGGNLIGNNDRVIASFPAGLPNGNGDFVGTPASPLDPGLLPLGDYGGPTPTVALALDSIALDAGTTLGGPEAPAADQRGRPRIQDGDCDAVESVDIGAFEHDDCRGGNVNAAGLSLVFSDDMESGAGNFTTSSPTGNGNWAVRQSVNACSPDHAWFSRALEEVKDDYLDTLPIQLSDDCTTLKFGHFYDMEAAVSDPNLAYDGCVLEISVDGGPFFDLGDRIVQGGYNRTISTGFASPIAGRMAWSGLSNPCEQVEVDLSLFGGSEIVLRWRLACDSSVRELGWYVDDVRICEQGGQTNQDVLFINGSAGAGIDRRVLVGTDQPISVELQTSEAGPDNARYLVYVWLGDSSSPAIFDVAGTAFGVLVNPGPLQGGGPQPFRCLRGTGISPAVCQSVIQPPAPARAPWTVNNSGISNPNAKFTLQGLIEDFGSPNSVPFSATNAVILELF